MLMWAADPTGSIAGRVVDPSNATIAGAKITAANVNTGLTRETTSAVDGGFVLPLLPVGIYRLTIEASGFQRFEQVGIEVRADESSSVPAALSIGSSTETVTVQANAQMIETQSGALRGVITTQNISELPLNGRLAASLILLSPGTVDLSAGNAGGSGDSKQTVSYPGAQSISANGGRADTVNYNMDGGSNQDHYTNVNNPFPNPDAIEEFSVLMNSYSAEYGRGSGAVVNVVTKSGTNTLHGSLFEFLRNGDMDARNFFAAHADKLKQNQFGASAGGQIVKNKLFFFGTYQGTQISNVSSGNSATVPTAAQRVGNFSSIQRQLVNPSTGLPFLNNQIPVSLFTGASQKILQLLPLPTAANGVSYYDLPDREHENQYMGRVDYNMSKHRIYGRYLDSRYPKDPVVGDKNILTSTRGYNLVSQSASASDTYTITPSLLNSFVVSYNRNDGKVVSGAPFSMTDLGSAVTSTNPAELSIAVSGYFSIGSGHPTEIDRKNFHFSDTLHWIKGSHDLAMGGDFMRMNVNINNTYRQNGAFTFKGTGYSGNALSDFLLGDAQKFIQGGGEFAARQGNLGSMFVQDNYRASRSLVFNLGLRWDPFVPYSDAKGRTECFLPGHTSRRFPNAPAGYLFAGDPGCPDGGFSSSWRQFAPRVGFAYNPGGQGKTTIRGGWGMFYQPPFVEAFNNMVDSAPFSPQYQLFDTSFMDPYRGTTNPFPGQYSTQSPSSNATFALPLSLAVAYQPNWRPAQSMNWNLTIERQLANNILARFGYVASKGTHLSYNTDANAPLPSATATADNEQARRPYQQFQQITMDTSGGNSIYNALQVSLEKRFSHGVSVSANYTWSKVIDAVSYATDLDTVNVINPYNVNAFRSVADYNIPHRLLVNYLWQLPSPKEGWMKAVFGGWESAGIWTWQSGFPLNISSGGDYSYSVPENANDQAQLVSTPHYTSGSTQDKLNAWFTTSSFTTPPSNSFGNVGRNTLVGPGTFNIDFSVHRAFVIQERFKLQLRAEAFNVLNHAQFNNPDTTVVDDNFGQITGARSPRIMQVALKLVF